MCSYKTFLSNSDWFRRSKQIMKYCVCIRISHFVRITMVRTTEARHTLLPGKSEVFLRLDCRTWSSVPGPSTACNSRTARVPNQDSNRHSTPKCFPPFSFPPLSLLVEPQRSAKSSPTSCSRCVSHTHNRGRERACADHSALPVLSVVVTHDRGAVSDTPIPFPRRSTSPSTAWR